MTLSSWWHEHVGQLKLVGDGVSVGALVATIAAWLPPAAAALTLVWTAMRIVDEWPKFKQNVIRWFRDND